MRDALDSICDPKGQQYLKAELFNKAADYFKQHGGAGFAMPRPLAIYHEVGHAIVAAFDGVTVKRVEVHGKTLIQLFRNSHGRNPRKIERQRLEAAGFNLTHKQWGGWCYWQASPFPGDIPGTVINLNTADDLTFGHRVRMELGGICGEEVLCDSEVPQASSLDEIVASQAMCLNRLGDHASAHELWGRLWRQTCAIIKQNEPTAHALVTALRDTDSIEGPSLQTILKGVHGT